MIWRNTRDSYGMSAIALHWTTALAVIGLFMLGLWMVELDYYNAWYNRAPYLHKSIGIVLFPLVLIRLIWRLSNPHPQALGTTFEKKTAQYVQLLLYLLLFSVMFSGYLISTADGRPIEVFGLFPVPAIISGIENQEDIAGRIHKILAYSLIGVASTHALAALKHHFKDRDVTLKRMLRPGN